LNRGKEENMADDVVLPIRRLRRRRPDTRDIRTSESLSDGERDELLASEDVGNKLLLQLVGSEVEEGRKTDDHSSLKTVGVATSAAANELLGHDLLAEVVELLALDAAHKGEAVKEFGRTEPLRGRNRISATKAGNRRCSDAERVQGKIEGQRTNHGVEVHRSHLLNEFDSRPLPILFVKLSIRLNLLVDELAHRSLKGAVVAFIVGRACEGGERRRSDFG
jgi:hypothetical protein